MHLTKLLLRDFGKFHNAEMTLEPGLNVIEGGKGSGKTTVAGFIGGIFFGIRKRPREAEGEGEYIRFKPISYKGYSGTGYIRQEGKSYLIDHTFLAGARKTSVLDVSSGRDVQLKNPNTLTGTLLSTDKNTYLDTFVITETEGAAADQLTSYLANKIDTGSGNIDKRKAIAYLQDRLQENDPKPLIRRLENLNEQIEAYDGVDEALEENRKALRQLTDDFAIEAERRKREARELVENEDGSVTYKADEALDQKIDRVTEAQTTFGAEVRPEDQEEEKARRKREKALKKEQKKKEKEEAKKAKLEAKKQKEEDPELTEDKAGEAVTAEDKPAEDKPAEDKPAEEGSTEEKTSEEKIFQENTPEEKTPEERVAALSEEDKEASIARVLEAAKAAGEAGKEKKKLSDNFLMIILTALFVVGVIAVIVYLLPFEDVVRKLFIIFTALFVLITILTGLKDKGYFDSQGEAVPTEEDFNRVLQELEDEKDSREAAEFDMAFAKEYSEKKDRLMQEEKELLEKKNAREKLQSEQSQVFKKKTEMEEEVTAIRLAISTIEGLSRGYREKAAATFVPYLSEYISRLTKDAYAEIAFDSREGLVVDGYRGRCAISKLQEETVRRIYLAIRLSVVKHMKEEQLPVVIDDMIRFTDVQEAGTFLDILSDLDAEQIVMMTGDDKLRRALEERKMTYNLERL